MFNLMSNFSGSHHLLFKEGNAGGGKAECLNDIEELDEAGHGENLLDLTIYVS